MYMYIFFYEFYKCFPIIVTECVIILLRFANVGSVTVFYKIWCFFWILFTDLDFADNGVVCRLFYLQVY